MHRGRRVGWVGAEQLLPPKGQKVHDLPPVDAVARRSQRFGEKVAAEWQRKRQGSERPRMRRQGGREAHAPAVAQYTSSTSSVRLRPDGPEYDGRTLMCAAVTTRTR